MNPGQTRFAARFAVMAALCMAPMYGTAYVLGTNTQVTVTGSNNLNAIAIGYNATNGAIQSTFSTNFLVKGDGTGSSNPLNFSSAPYTNVGGSLYFVFVLDSQETNNNESLSIDKVELKVNTTTIWSTTEAILLNSGTPLTLTPLGNGADMALYVPVAAFNGLGLKGSDTFVFTATHSLSHNGNEEWLFTNRGVATPTSFFASNATIQDVPEPSTIGLALAGLCAVAIRARRRARS